MPLRKPNNGKQWATGTITTASDGTFNLSGLSFAPSFIMIRNNNVMAFLSSNANRIYANSTYYLSGCLVNYGQTNAYALMQGTGYDDRLTNNGCICKIGVGNQVVTWTAFA